MDIQEIQNIVARCTQCKACEQMCSVFLRHGKFAAWEKLQIVKKYCGLNELSDFEIEAVFTCTKCEGCQSVCPENLPLIELFDWARNQFTKKYGFFNSRQPVVVNNIKRSGNPFNQSRSAEIEKISKGHQKHSDILLHLGCLITHRMPSTFEATVKILEYLDIEFSILKEERCCAYFVWNAGDHNSAMKLIEKNVKDMKEYQKIVCACAGCYTFLKSHYESKLPKGVEIVHLVELLSEKLPADGHNMQKAPGNEVAYHDSCHLARPHGIIEEPRNLLKSMGYKPVELENSREKTICCGADGGMRFINPDLAKNIGIVRLEYVARKSKDLYTLCPFCMFNFQDAISNSAIPLGVEIKDLYIELAQRLNLLREKIKITEERTPEK